MTSTAVEQLFETIQAVKAKIVTVLLVERNALVALIGDDPMRQTYLGRTER